ncbi:hypothetical protein OEZ85_007325 [Tetradesmus obliquus]|uniref:Uncharacterized protein n=1 Tax=Tetradesmus obliquus TaxID=3088 RepID=A0ABY8TXT1_TETOB|nr:hypothetical protein OEZ85_007321 [Tetradesmus obliquus]WIA13775.1 hypothetical protein OEZ85_007325 [Tetradesmus obliquus]
MAGFNTLCSFQQAQELSADMVEGLVEATFSVIKQAPAATPLLGKVWPLLCQLPQAQHIQPATILAWLGQCLSQERHQAAAALAVLLDQAAVLTAWGGLTRQEVEQLLARALPVAKRGSVQGLKATCSMQCVRSVMNTSTVVHVLDAALVFRGLRASASRMAAIPAAGLIDDAQAALSGIRAALEKDKADSFSSSTRRMMKSMPFSVYRLKRAGNALSPSQVAQQTVAAATGAVLAEQKVPLRVWLGMQVVAALQELQAAATHDL